MLQVQQASNSSADTLNLRMFDELTNFWSSKTQDEREIYSLSIHRIAELIHIYETIEARKS